MIAGFLLQAAALAHGGLSVVEPILVLELPFTLVIASRVFHAGLHRREWLASLGMTVGLAAMLYFLDPAPGDSRNVPWQVWAAGAGANLAVVGAAVQWGRRAGAGTAGDGPEGGSRRAAAFAVATGCQFGLTATFIKGMADRFQDGIGAVLAAWQLYAMVASGLLAMFLLQSAMHAGSLVAAQPGLTLCDPVVSILWGVLAFGEDVRTGLPLLFAAAGGALTGASVLVLARSPVLSGAFADPGGRRSADTRTGGVGW